MVRVLRRVSRVCRGAAPSVAFAACVLLAACGGTPTEPTVNVPYEVRDIRVGTGQAAALGDTVSIHAQGWVYSTMILDRKGTQFATTIGGPPLDVQLVSEAVLEGWIRGLPGMRVGGLRQLILPPDLAYGDSGGGVVPEKSTVIFDIELIEIK